MRIEDYRNEVQQQLDLLETMCYTVSSDNILRDILAELFEVGKLTLGEKPTVFFKFIEPRNTHNENYKSYYALYQDGRPWGGVVSCVSGKIITLVDGLTRASCFLRYGAEDLAYQPEETPCSPGPCSPLDHYSLEKFLDISEHNTLENHFHIPNNLQCLKGLPSRAVVRSACDANAEQFLKTNLEHLLGWIGIMCPPYRDKDQGNIEARTKCYLRSSILKLFNTLGRNSEPVPGIMYDATVNVLLVYMDSTSFLTYLAYDVEMRREALRLSAAADTVKLPVPILKPTIPINPASIRQLQTFGTIKPRASIAHNSTNLRKKLDKDEITTKLLRDLLAELAKEAYMRRRSAKFEQENYKYRTHFPIKADAKPVILSRHKL